MNCEIVKVFKGEKTNRLPVWLMRQAGRYLPEYRELRAKAGSFLNLCFEPKWAAEVTLQPLKRFDLDAAIIFSDILVLPHALGQGLVFEHGEGPKLDAISDISGLLDRPIDKIISPVYETLEIVRAQLPKEKGLIGFAGSPWTVASYMIEGGGGHDFSKIKGMILDNKQNLDAIIDVLVVHTSQHLKAQIKAGADAVQLFESWAGVLSGDDFRQYVIMPNKRIVAEVKKEYPDVPVVFFPRTDMQQDLINSLDVGADVMGLSQGVDLGFAANELQNKICLQGNLAPQILLGGGLEMKAGVESICRALGQKPFVFNLGHGVIKETPPEHVGALVDMVHEWRA